MTTSCRTVQLRRPSVTMAADSDEAAAVASRRKALNLVFSNQWWVGGAHPPFPGVGHLRRDPDRHTWLPVTFVPVDLPESPESSPRQRTGATTL